MAEHLPVAPGTPRQFQKYLFSDEYKHKFQMAVPKWLSVDRLLRVVFTSVLKNPKLLECTTESLMGAVMQCAQLGLEPILGRAHLIPYRNNRKPGKPLECQFQPGYQGLVDLAERSGKVETVKAHVVYENDEFEIEYGLNERLVHRPKMDGDRGKPIGAYTVWTRTTGVKTYTFMLLQDIYRDFRSKSTAYNYAIKDKRSDTPWIENEPEMLKKSLVKRHSKLEPASVEFMQAVEVDNMADIGETSQVTMLNDLPDEETTEDLSGAVDQFDAGIPKDIDLETLQKFLAVCSKHFEKTVEEIKAEATQDDNFWPQFRDWAKKHQPSKEDAIRKLYKGLKDPNFRKFVESCKDEIPTYPEVNQAEIKAGWKKRFKDEPFPGSDGQPVDAEFTENDDEKFMRLVAGAEESTSGLACNCPETLQGVRILKTKCETGCKRRSGCPSWEDFDKE